MLDVQVDLLKTVHQLGIVGLTDHLLPGQLPVSARLLISHPS